MQICRSHSHRILLAFCRRINTLVHRTQKGSTSQTSRQSPAQSFRQKNCHGVLRLSNPFALVLDFFPNLIGRWTTSSILVNTLHQCHFWFPWFLLSVMPALFFPAKQAYSKGGWKAIPRPNKDLGQQGCKWKQHQQEQNVHGTVALGNINGQA